MGTQVWLPASYDVAAGSTSIFPSPSNAEPQGEIQEGSSAKCHSILTQFS